MKTIKFATLLILISGLFAINLVACNWDGSSGKSGKSTPQPSDLLANHLTATYGADQFHIQLTAIVSQQTGESDKLFNGADFSANDQSLLTGGAAGP